MWKTFVKVDIMSCKVGRMHKIVIGIVSVLCAGISTAIYTNTPMFGTMKLNAINIMNRVKLPSFENLNLYEETSGLKSLHGGLTSSPIKIAYIPKGNHPFISKYLASFNFSSCNRSLSSQNCEIVTIKQDILDSYDFDALVVSAYPKKYKIPDLIKARQNRNIKFVFYGSEAAAVSLNTETVDKYDTYFNLTFIYKQTSTIPKYHGRCSKRQADDIKSRDWLATHLPEFNVRSERELVSWIISKCYNTQSRRKIFMKELRKYLKVDVYGGCGRPLKKGRPTTLRTINNYKFYLALENSLCEDYLTEKSFNALVSYAVPIVLGYNNYSLSLPPSSYIDVRDFQNVKELADYILYLDTNVPAYLKYHEWRMSYTCELVEVNYEGCILCEHLNLNRDVQEMVPSIKSFWHKERDCLPAQSYFGKRLKVN